MYYLTINLFPVGNISSGITLQTLIVGQIYWITPHPPFSNLVNMQLKNLQLPEGNKYPAGPQNNP